ncbi:MAG: hypothetical protein MAG715_00448 [Methanonatronarchaeales archaeon]|nr:hypothetical protein [Methanonatronarchaeales archaeon]
MERWRPVKRATRERMARSRALPTRSPLFVALSVTLCLILLTGATTAAVTAPGEGDGAILKSSGYENYSKPDRAEAREVRRGPTWVDRPGPNGTRTLTLHTGPVNYFNGSDYVPIDPNVTKAGKGRYGVTKGQYKAHWNDRAELRVTDGEHSLTYREKGVNHGGKSRRPDPPDRANVKGNRISLRAVLSRR